MREIYERFLSDQEPEIAVPNHVCSSKIRTFRHLGIGCFGPESPGRESGTIYWLRCRQLTVCLRGKNYVLKGVYKNLNILVGLIFGYILSIIFTVAGIAPMVDFSGIQETIDQVGFFSIPKLVLFTSHKPVFNLGTFLPLRLSFWLLGGRRSNLATTAAVYRSTWTLPLNGGTQGSLAVDGFSSAITGCFVPGPEYSKFGCCAQLKQGCACFNS